MKIMNVIIISVMKSDTNLILKLVLLNSTYIT